MEATAEVADVPCTCPRNVPCTCPWNVQCNTCRVSIRKNRRSQGSGISDRCAVAIRDRASAGCQTIGSTCRSHVRSKVECCKSDRPPIQQMLLFDLAVFITEMHSLAGEMLIVWPSTSEDQPTRHCVAHLRLAKTSAQPTEPRPIQSSATHSPANQHTVPHNPSSLPNTRL